MTKKKDITAKPDENSVSAKVQDNILNEKLEPGEVRHLETGENLEIVLSIKEILSPFISDRMNEFTGQLPDETPFRLEVAAPAPRGYSMVITLGDWRRLHKLAKSL